MSAENKVTVYLKTDILADLRQIGVLYERSVSWLLMRAWAIAREKLWEEAQEYAKTKLNSHPFATLASVVLSAWGAWGALPTPPHMPDSLFILFAVLGVVGVVVTTYAPRPFPHGYTQGSVTLPGEPPRYALDDRQRLYDTQTGAVVTRDEALLDLVQRGPVGISTLAGSLHLNTKQAHRLVRRLEANGLVRMSRKRVRASQ